ncbi:MAG: dephospho-CoA kinase, partial [Chloroflexota bacterium]
VAPIEATFPGVTNDGVVDRGRLTAKVLADPNALRRLEAIVHPLVWAARGAKVVVYDVPLLFETGTEKCVDVIVVVSAPEDVQKARVLARPGMTEEKLAAILAKQVPDSEKRVRADFLVDTGGGVEAARSQVRDILRQLDARD